MDSFFRSSNISSMVLRLFHRSAELKRIIRLVIMAKKSRNNRRKTMGLYTTSPTQYIPLCNPAKYMNIYDRKTGFITVTNIKQDRVVGVFDLPELCEYLRIWTSHSN